LFEKQKSGTHNNNKDWFTQHCEDAPDLKGYKIFILACQFVVKKSGKS
jgi:hypothetical protein